MINYKNAHIQQQQKLKCKINNGWKVGAFDIENLIEILIPRKIANKSITLMLK